MQVLRDQYRGKFCENILEIGNKNFKRIIVPFPVCQMEMHFHRHNYLAPFDLQFVQSWHLSLQGMPLILSTLLTQPWEEETHSSTERHCGLHHCDIFKQQWKYCFFCLTVVKLCDIFVNFVKSVNRYLHLPSYIL